MATVDAILVIVERCFEFKLLAEYYRCDDSAWLTLTAVSMLLPGTVGTVLWAAQALKKRIAEDMSLQFVFGVGLSVIVWPISSVIWYVFAESLCSEITVELIYLFRTVFVAGYCLKEGDEAVQKLYDVTNLQRALHSCLENAPQTVLQIYIIISTWGDTGSAI